MIPGIVAAQGAATTAPATDPYWVNVLAYLPLTSDFSDVKGNAVTNVGSCSIDTGDPDGPCLLAPSASYLSVPLNAQLGSRDWTFEFFLKADSVGGFSGIASFECVVGQDYGNLAITMDSTFWVSFSGTSWTHLSQNIGAMGGGVLRHIAITRQAGTIRAFNHGTLVTTINDATAFTQKGPTLLLGKKSDQLAGGHTIRMKHVRVTMGVARYTASFTPLVPPFPTS